MLMMLIVCMPVLMCYRNVTVAVPVPLAEMQPDANAHESSGDDQRPVHRIAEGYGQDRTKEGGDCEVGAGASCAEVAHGDDEEDQARPVGQKANGRRGADGSGRRK